jgi:hypothetical protein
VNEDKQAATTQVVAACFVFTSWPPKGQAFAERKPVLKHRTRRPFLWEYFPLAFSATYCEH